MERYWVWEYGLFEKNPKRVDSLNPETTLEVVKLADVQATVAALQAQLAQQVEALQCELLKWKRALCNLTPGGSEFADDHAYCAEWVRKARENQHDIIISKHRELKAAQAALDAEREKMKDSETAYKMLSEQWNATDLNLTQIQALVRALIYSDNAPEHDRAWFALRATLDATTPAPRQRQVHSCEIPGCVSCANPEEGGDGE